MIRISETLEMMDRDYTQNINIYDLNIDESLASLGWRLPSPEELRLMLALHKSGIGSFKLTWYMTNESNGGFTNLEIHFGSSKEEEFDTSESHWGCCCVRLVRTI